MLLGQCSRYSGKYGTMPNALWGSPMTWLIVSARPVQAMMEKDTGGHGVVEVPYALDWMDPGRVGAERRQLRELLVARRISCRLQIWRGRLRILVKLCVRAESRGLKVAPTCFFS